MEKKARSGWGGWGIMFAGTREGGAGFWGREFQSEGAVHAEALRNGHGGRSEEWRGRGSPLEKGWTST